jgi:hypothetical protein
MKKPNPVGYRKVNVWVEDKSARPFYQHLRKLRFFGYALLKLEILGPVVCPIGYPGEAEALLKRRTSSVRVLSAQHPSSDCYKRGKMVRNARYILTSEYTNRFVYKVGKVAKSVLDLNLRNDCSKGTYFFYSLAAAMNYSM